MLLLGHKRTGAQSYSEMVNGKEHVLGGGSVRKEKLLDAPAQRG